MAGDDVELHGMNVKLVEYSPKYHGQVVRMYMNAMEEYRPIVNAEEEVDIDRIIREVRESFKDIDTMISAHNGGRIFLFVTKDDDLAVAQISVCRTDNDVLSNAVSFQRIVVASDWRRRGLCIRLVNHAIKFSRDHLGAQRVYLYTLEAFRGAVALYQRLGFQEEYLTAKGPETGWYSNAYRFSSKI